MAEMVVYLFGGGVQVTLRADDQLELIRQAAFYTQLPRECPVCGAPVHFSYRAPQDYEYYGLECSGNPRHESTFGQYKGGKGLFYKGAHSWRKAGQPDETGAPEPPPAHPETKRATPSQASTVTREEASAFFAEMAKVGIRPHDLRPFVQQVNPEGVGDLTKLTHEELERVRRLASLP